MPENRAKLGKEWLVYGIKAMHDGDIISAPYQFVYILGLLIPSVLVAVWVEFPSA